MAPTTSTFDTSTDIPDLTNKVIFITGGTAGIGAQSIRYLAAKGPSHIYFTGRNSTAAESLITFIKKTSPDVSMTFIPLDMSSLSSISSALKPYITPEALSTISRIDILIAAAGVMAPPSLSPWTEDRFEAHFGINHLGNALIIRLLLPTLLSTAANPLPHSLTSDVRVVLLTSLAWRAVAKSGINYGTVRELPNSKNHTIGSFASLPADLKNYARSKLANILYARALSLQYPYSSHGITAVAIHPGVVDTGLVSGLSRSWRWLVKITNIGSIVGIEEGCGNGLWAATASTASRNMQGAAANASAADNGTQVAGATVNAVSGEDDRSKGRHDCVESGKWYLPVGVEGEEKGTTLEMEKGEKAARELWEWTEEVFEEAGVLR